MGKLKRSLPEDFDATPDGDSMNHQFVPHPLQPVIIDELAHMSREDFEGTFDVKVDPAKFYKEPAPETKIERFAREVLGVELTAQQMEFMSDIIRMQAEGKQIVIQRGRTAGQATLRKVMAKYLEDGLEVEDAR